jgi:hypothetical protein
MRLWKVKDKEPAVDDRPVIYYQQFRGRYLWSLRNDGTKIWCPDQAGFLRLKEVCPDHQFVMIQFPYIDSTAFPEKVQEEMIRYE